jgi:hypothetical protein
MLKKKYLDLVWAIVFLSQETAPLLERLVSHWRCSRAVPEPCADLEHMPPFGRHALAANDDDDHENRGKYPGGDTNFGC